MIAMWTAKPVSAARDIASNAMRAPMNQPPALNNGPVIESPALFNFSPFLCAAAKEALILVKPPERRNVHTIDPAERGYLRADGAFAVLRQRRWCFIGRGGI
jgi:hypothetical protein